MLKAFRGSIVIVCFFLTPTQATTLSSLCEVQWADRGRLPHAVGEMYEDTTKGVIIRHPTRTKLEDVRERTNEEISIVSNRSVILTGPTLESLDISEIDIRFQRKADLPVTYSPKTSSLSQIASNFIVSIRLKLTSDAVLRGKDDDYLSYVSIGGELTPIGENCACVGYIKWLDWGTNLTILNSLVGAENLQAYESVSSPLDKGKPKQIPITPVSIVLYDTSLGQKREFDLTEILVSYPYVASLIDISKSWQSGKMMADTHFQGGCIGKVPDPIDLPLFLDL